MSLMKTFALLQLLIIMNNVSVQAATLRIQGGSTVHVGDRVNITCTCHVIKCFQGVHFRISGVEHNFSTLEGGEVTNYNLEYTTDWNTLTTIYTLVLINATVNDNGTAYQCTPSVHEGEVEWSNNETLTILASDEPSQIKISLDPQPALIGEDIQIRCEVMQIPVEPRIAVNDKEETLQSLANREKYTTNSPFTNGVAVYVLTLHNVSVSDNGTRFECFVRSHGRRITSGTRVLRVGYKDILTTTTATTTTKSEEILIAPSSENLTFPLRTIDSYEWPIPTTTTTKTTKANFATPITEPTATPEQPTSEITGGPSQIKISLDPQPALIGEDVQIRCTLVQIPVQPRIAVNYKEETLRSLANREKYTLINSPITNGVAVYVLTLHNVSVSDNGTRFECFVRLHGRRITSGNVRLNIRCKGGPSTITTTPTTVKGSMYTTDLSEIVSTQVQTLEQSTFCVSPTILVAPETSTVELYTILIPAGVLVGLLVISLFIIAIMALVLVNRRQHERGINGAGIEEILEERKENIYVM